MLSTLSPLSLLIGVLAFPTLALACYYNDFGEYICDDDINWTTYYAVRVGIGLGVAALIFLITFCAVLWRRRRLRATNATYIKSTAPSGNVPPPVYGQGYPQGTSTYYTPYAANAGGGYSYSYAAYPPKAFDKQGQYAPVASTDNQGYSK